MTRRKIALTLVLLGSVAAIVLGVLGGGDAKRAHRTVVLVMLDTVGFEGVFTDPSQAPFVSSLAQKSAFFSQAYSTAPWTKPSIASVLTASLPARHGVRLPNSRISRGVISMAQYFSKQGFATAGFVSHIFLAPKTDYNRGFATYDIAKFDGSVHDSITASQITDLGLEWLRRPDVQERDRFLFLHYFDPHFNYKHHAAFSQTDWYSGSLSDQTPFDEFRKKGSKLSQDDLRFMKGLYGEEIQQTDSQLRRLYDGINAMGKGDEIVLVLTGDHGEAFWQHELIGHNYQLYNELVHVPLVFYAPGLVSPHTISSPVSTMDVFPSLVELLRLPPIPRPIDGKSFEPLLVDPELDTHERHPLFEIQHLSHKVGAVLWPWKIIFNQDKGSWEVYNLERDPLEAENVGSAVSDVAEVSEGMSQIKAYISGRATDSPPPTLAPEKYSSDEVEKLKTLGYVM